MTSEQYAPDEPGSPRSTREAVREQVRRKGLQPLRSAEELRADVFDSDEELGEFLDHVYASRREGAA